MTPVRPLANLPFVALGVTVAILFALLVWVVNQPDPRSGDPAGDRPPAAAPAGR